MADRIAGKISVITPCYNEAGHIRENVLEISRFFSEFAERYELICVDDGSTDDTLLELRAVADADPNLKILHYPQNQGKGFALRHGFEASDGNYIVFLDADLDLHPYLLREFFHLLIEEKADVVVGSKRHPESRISYPRRRKVISAIYHYILLILFGLPVRDTQVGLKLFKREALDSVFDKIICKRFALDVELLANIHRSGYRIVEAPIKLDFKRKVRWGRIGFSTLQNTLIDTMAVFYRMYILKYYDLTFLNRNSYPDIAVVVQYDNHSSGVAETLNGCLQLEYRKLRIIALGPYPPGVASKEIEHIPLEPDSQALIEAIQKWPAEALAFIRPGSIPATGWLENCARNFGSDNVVAVSGPALSSGNADFWSEAGRRVLCSITGCGGIRYRYMESLHRYIHTVAMDNLIVRKKDLLSALERSSFTSGVETWLGGYLHQQRGRRIVYDPAVAVYNRVPPLYRAYLSDIFDWGLSRGSYFRHNPSALLKWPHTIFLLPSLWLLVMLAAIPLVFINLFLAKTVAIGMAIYLLSVLVESGTSLRPDMTAAVMAGIISTHVVYGAGCLAAFVHPGLKRSKSVVLEAKH
jgi:glycosyltransferase involved in cell wall biosynthesis